MSSDLIRSPGDGKGNSRKGLLTEPAGATGSSVGVLGAGPGAGLGSRIRFKFTNGGLRNRRFGESLVFMD